MSKRSFPETLIPPSINDARSRALLKAFEFAARQLDFSQLLKRNEHEMSCEDLSLALHDLSMNEFVPPDGLPENAARNLIASSWPLQEKKGTDEGVKIGLNALGLEAEIIHWWQEELISHHDTHVIELQTTEIFPDEPGSGPKSVRAIKQMVDETKRWSQGTSLAVPVEISAQPMINALVLTDVFEDCLAEVTDEATLNLPFASAAWGICEEEEGVVRDNFCADLPLGAAFYGEIEIAAMPPHAA